MTRTRWLALLLAAGACGTRAPAANTTLPPQAAPEAVAPAAASEPVAALVFPDEPFRATQPKAQAFRDLNPPGLAEFKLKNGITVFLVERHTLPTVTMDLVFEGGSIDDPSGKEGLASLCVDLVTEGTDKLDKVAFSEAQADLASSISSHVGVDQQGVALRTLSKNLDATLDLWADALLRPGMRQADFDRIVNERLEGLTQMEGTPTQIGQRLLGSVVYGATHAYGRFFTKDSTKRLTLDDCKAYVTSRFKPQGAKLYVMGDITRAQIEEKLGARLGSWKGSPKKMAKVGKPQPRDGKIFFVDVPGAPQSVVYLTHTGPARKAKDFFQTNLMSQVLGGSFSSRINMNIREKHGYAYGAYGGFRYNRDGSTFAAGGSVRSDVTKESIMEILNEVRNMRDSDVTDDELDREKNGTILGLPALWATGGDVLGTYRNLIYFGLPLDYYASYVPNVMKVSRAEVRQAAQQHLKPTELRVLVVGDSKTVLPKLQELGTIPELAGKVVVLNVDGKVQAQ